MIKTMSLRRKILLTAVAIGSVLGIVLMVVTVFIIRQIVVSRTEGFFKETVTQIGRRIDMQLHNANINIESIADSQLLLNNMNDLKHDRLNYNIAKYRIMRNVINLTDFEGIDGIYIFPDGKQPVINCFYREPQFTAENDWYKNMEAALRKNYPAGIWEVSADDRQYLSQYRAIMENGDLYGILQIRYEDSVMRGILDPAANNLEGEFFIQDQHGIVLSASITGWIGQSMTENFGGDKILLEHRLEIEPWVLTGAIERSSITRQVWTIVSLFAVIFIALMAAISAYALLALRYIRYPLNKIMFGFGSLGNGNLDVRLENDTDMEFKFIIEGFNAMARRLENLVKQVYDQEVSYRKAEISALQGKLNPHFLYNTLDVIYWRVLMQGDENSAEILVALSGILRYSISHGNEFVTLEEDIRHTESYLKIQRILFQHRLQYSIEIPQDLYTMKIPKLVMQPVLENAVKHAFSDKDGMLELSVRAEIEGDDVYFILRDNGIGMSGQTLSMVLRAMDTGESPRDGGLGLQIVHRRLRHTYGNGYGVTLASEPGAGTTVSLRINRNIEKSLRDNLGQGGMRNAENFAD